MNPRISHAVTFLCDQTKSLPQRVPGSVTFVVAFLLISLPGLTSANGQAPTAKQKQLVKQIKTNIDRAGKQFKAEKFEASRDYIDQAIKQVDALASEAGPELMEWIKPEYSRLAKAHQLLTAAGQKLAELKPLPEPMTGEPQLETRIVAAKVNADSPTHEELAANRKELATETWKLVMADVESRTLPGKNFIVTGSTSESRLADVAILCEKLVPKIASALRADSNKPLVKGNVSVFVFDKRYDFSEFGKMVEQRDFPKEISAHWGFTTIDAYATVLMTKNQTHEDVQADLAHQIAALYTANLAPDVPRWFADGVGLWTAKKIFAKEDAMMSLDSRAEAAAASMIKPDDFVQNRMPSDRAALVSYLFIKKLRSQSAAYSKLMKSLNAGESFKTSFAMAFGGTPSQVLGQKDDGAKRRRDR